MMHFKWVNELMNEYLNIYLDVLYPLLTSDFNQPLKIAIKTSGLLRLMYFKDLKIC